MVEWEEISKMSNAELEEMIKTNKRRSLWYAISLCLFVFFVGFIVILLLGVNYES